jgi:predicted metal-dependent HD superfamily phosphohydrolase
MNELIIKKSEEYVRKVLSERCPVHFKYHNFYHVQKVVEAAIQISEHENVNDEEKEIIILASLFHDIGYIDLCEGHEEVSCSYADEFLLKENYPKSRIEKVNSCILATKIPQQPKNKIEMIVCDADLHHLGSEDFFEVGNNLRSEIEYTIKKQFTDSSWLETTIRFNKSHSYFTDYAKRVYGIRKEKNIEELEKMLKQALVSEH